MGFPRLNLTIASGTILLALVLHFFVAISLPFIQPLYVVETSFNSNNTKQEVAIGSSQKLTQIRLGIWAACYDSQNKSACFKRGSGYNVTITENKSQITVVESSWTGGLPFQVFAGGCTLVAFVLAHFFSRSYRFVTLIAVIIAGGATLIALLIELALFKFVQGKMNSLGAGAKTSLGSGFWMTLIPAALLGAALLWLFLMDKPSSIDNEDQTPTDPEDDSTPAPPGSDRPDHVKSETFTPVSLFKPQLGAVQQPPGPPHVHGQHQQQQLQQQQQQQQQPGPPHVHGQQQIQQQQQQPGPPHVHGQQLQQQQQHQYVQHQPPHHPHVHVQNQQYVQYQHQPQLTHGHQPHGQYGQYQPHGQGYNQDQTTPAVPPPYTEQHHNCHDCAHST